MAYRIYVTDTLRIISENTARAVNGSAVTTRFVDLLKPKPQDNRTAEEIVEDVILKAGLVVRE